MNRLNLGSGKDYRQGWVNVDFDSDINADKHFDLRDKFPLGDNSFDHVLAQDVLEHFRKEDSSKFIGEIYRVLKPGGSLELRVPNVYDIVDRFYHNPEIMFTFLYGNTSAGELGSHKTGFTKKSLNELLNLNGFVDIAFRMNNTNFVINARKRLEIEGSFNIAVSLLSSADIGGAENFLIWLGSEFKKKNNDVGFFVVRKSNVNDYLGGFKVYVTSWRMDIIGFGKGLIKFCIFFLPSTIEYLGILMRKRKVKNNVFIVSGISDKIIISPIAKLLGYKIIWIEFGPIKEVLQRNFGIPFLLYRLSMYFSDVIVVPSQNTKKQIIGILGISEHKVKLIHCGIPDKSIKTGKAKSGEFTIGLVSRLEPGKGHDTILKVAKKLKSKIRGLKVVFIGPGDDRQLRKLARKLAIQKQVKFLGFKEDAWEIASNWNAFIFPSRWKLEGFGIAPLEAMQIGLPVVASNIGPVPEVVGEAGIICEDDPEVYADAIFKLYKNKKLARKYSILGKARAKEFSMKNIENEYKNLLRNINQK